MRGAPISGLCLGTIPGADAGLLAGRRAVTHWQAFDHLAVRHPDVALDQSVLYIDHRDVLTSAGTASAVDACLHLVRTRLGAEAANRVARSLVIAPHWEGGQAQYNERPVPARSNDDPISRLCEWTLGRLGEPLTIARLAAQAHLAANLPAELLPLPRPDGAQTGPTSNPSNRSRHSPPALPWKATPASTGDRWARRAASWPWVSGRI